MQVLYSRSHSHNSHTLLSALCTDWAFSPFTQPLCTGARCLEYNPELLAQPGGSNLESATWGSTCTSYDSTAGSAATGTHHILLRESTDL